MQKLIDTLTKFTPLNEPLLLALAEVVSKKTYSKGDTLLQQGNICRHIYIIEKGFVRGFYLKNGKEITSWLADEGEAITSMYSFISQKAGIDNIEILEPSILWALSYDNLQKMYKTFPEFNETGRLLIEKYYLELEERTTSLQFQTAKERYETLVQSKPHILQRASLGQIASYLGMSQETLSRIRGKS
jgi:CRP/FNR family transcriptional regulator, anaerobic regulatory protein